jgi:hypothetical protein
MTERMKVYAGTYPTDGPRDPAAEDPKPRREPHWRRGHICRERVGGRLRRWRRAGTDRALERRLLDDVAGHVYLASFLYVNVTAPMRGIDVGHVGVPSFRGLDRRTVPGWFLLATRRSGLFAGRVIRRATAIVWFYAGADRYRRAVHLDDLTLAALTIMAESLSERGTGPADRSPGAGADAWGSGNLRSRRVIRMILISLGLGEASRNGQPFRSA